ncbi:hypothetical protein ACFE04_029419 [Oxalis oulophora]
MRLTKGSKVEILIPNESAWRCAEVTYGNGRFYAVKYTSSEGIEETNVARKFIRPLPPLLAIDELVCGDIVEVFHNDLWRSSTLVEVIGNNVISVRLFVSFDVIKTYRSHLRIPQYYENGEWLLAGQSYTGRSMVVQNTIEKVDVLLGKNYVFYHASNNNTKANRLSNEYTGSTTNDSPRISVDATSCCSSSVGSCSVDKYEFGITHHTNELDDYSSDAESSYVPEYKKRRRFVSRPTEADSSMSKLNKYRRVLESLYGAGSISWEQQEQLMDLRCTLNISDDEHLEMVKNLIKVSLREHHPMLKIGGFVYLASRGLQRMCAASLMFNPNDEVSDLCTVRAIEFRVLLVQNTVAR